MAFTSWGKLMARRKFWTGCLFILLGVAWPAMSITYAVSKYSEIYPTALSEHRSIDPSQKREVVSAVEYGIAAIVGGVVVSLFGFGLTLGSTRKRTELQQRSLESVEPRSV